MSDALAYDLKARAKIDQLFTSTKLGRNVFSQFSHQHYLSTPFGWDAVPFNPTNSARFGATGVVFAAPSNMDYMGPPFLALTIPGIVGLDTSGGVGAHTVITGVTSEPYWTNAVGQVLVKKCQFKVHGRYVDEVRGYGLFFHEELCGKPGKRLGEAIGKFDTVPMRQAQSRRSRELYVPLDFWFGQHMGQVFPMCSVAGNIVTFEVDFETLANCIIRPADFPTSNADVYVRADGLTDAQIEAATIPSVVADSNLSARMIVFAIVVSEAERAFTTRSRYQSVMTEHQYLDQYESETVSSATETTAAKAVQFRLAQLKNVVVEYQIAVRREAHETAKDWMNFGGYDDPVSEATLDPIKTMSITFNNSVRVQELPGKFFRLVVPLVVHTCIPRGFLYNWSWATDPERIDFSGALNHNSIPEIQLNINLDKRIFLNSASVRLLGQFPAKNMMHFSGGAVVKKFL